MVRSIAIVEDDRDQLTNYADALQKRGYEVHRYMSRPEAERGFAQRLPDLAILDIVLGHEVDGGLDLCRHLLSIAPGLPVIFLTDRTSELDKISGLLLAWDYVPKPITLEFLAAKVAAMFRILDAAGERSQGEAAVLQRGPLMIDESRARVEWKGEPVKLTVTEFEMLARLAAHPGHVATYDGLMESTRQTVVTKNTIITHVRRIRDKFVAVDPTFDSIENVYGLGYRWSED